MTQLWSEIESLTKNQIFGPMSKFGQIDCLTKFLLFEQNVFDEKFIFDKNFYFNFIFREMDEQLHFCKTCFVKITVRTLIHLCYAL